MAASNKEAVVVSESEQSDFLEGHAPGEGSNAMLLASDSYENLYYEDLDEFDRQMRPRGKIRTLSKSALDENHHYNASETNDLSTGEESTEEQIDTKDLAKAVSSLDITDAKQSADAARAAVELLAGKDIDMDEWRMHRKHIFILSQSGKPVYSRYGNEDKLVTIFGVMQALVSFVQDSSDLIRGMVAGDHKFVFLVREHLIIVGVSSGADSMQQLLLQLTYVYNQVISVLTYSTLSKIFKQRRSYDLRRLLSGAEKFIDNLLNMMDREMSILLGSVRCLPLESDVREIITQSIVQQTKVKDLVFAMIIANNQLIALVHMKKHYLHPMDLHLIFNLVDASESFKAAETWMPICLPKFDSSGFLHAHVSYLDDNMHSCLLLLTVDRDSFFTLSACKEKIKERLIRYNCLQAISDSLSKMSYNVHQCGIPDLRHFLYKSRSTAQYTSPEMEAPYLSEEEQSRLSGLYQYVHHRIHLASRPLKILYHVGQYETILGWVTQGFEMYAVFGPLVTKVTAIHAINKLLRWIKKEEDRLFIMNSVTF